MKFVVTIDTEADDQWKQDGVVTLANLEALPHFQAFMEERGVMPTYLCSYETLAHPVLKELAQAHAEGRAEVGGHLHPWTTPPFDTFDDEIQRFPLELPETALAEKLAVLTKTLAALLGEPPVSFRAGRWGADERVYRAVHAAGYRVDSSVTPGIEWRRVIKNPAPHAAIPDFRNVGPAPFTVSGTNLTEYPMSILPTGILPSLRLARYANRKDGIGRIARALSRPRWCRIFPETTLNDLIAVYRAARARSLSVLVFMIHSSELMVGASPYVKDQVALDRIYRLLDAFIEFLRQEQVECVRMRDLSTSDIIT